MKAIHEFSSEEEYKSYLKIYFAAMAMTNFTEHLYSSHADDTINEIAKVSVKFADALINALNHP